MKVLRLLYNCFAIIPRDIIKLIKATRQRGKLLDFWVAIVDMLFVLRGMWLFVFLNFLGIAFFIFLTQGTDLLTAVMEDTRQSYFGSITWLILGTFFWSIAAEFGARYSMNVADNSGKTLTDERVEWRKHLQRVFSRFFLVLPSLILIIGFTKAAITNYSFTLSGLLQPWKDVAGTILIFVFLFVFVYNLYRNQEFIRIAGRLLVFLRLGNRANPDEELWWQDKLYGIYRDYIFMFPESALPKEVLPTSRKMKVEEKNTSEHDYLFSFPQSEYVPPRDRVPGKFIVTRFERATEGDMWCRWVYKVPLSFYPRLHRQVAMLSLTAACLILIVSFLPIGYYKNIGSPALVTFAFASWIAITIGLIYLDNANPFRINPPWRLLLFSWMIICSFINRDHPVRRESNHASKMNTRPTLKDHFANWAARHPDDSIVVFVCAEGGALRTGAFASMILSRIQDKDSSFKNKIFAFSSVSGGSLGVGYFNALAYFNNHLETDTVFFTNKTKDFFARDHLAPVIGKMFYGDLLNLYSPRMVPAFDRASALERSWEEGYGANAAFKENRNVFKEDFYSVYNPSSGTWYPAWFINTEEVETGLQCWVSNVDAAALPLSKSRDVLRKVHGTVRYSTAINFSTRFPLFSPAGALQHQGIRYHYVDGGYVENYGAQTMLEVLRELSKYPAFHRYKPYVMLIQFGNDTKIKIPSVKFANELAEIASGIYNTRAGRGVYAKYDLQNFTDSLHGQFIDLTLDLPTRRVPMNWILSDTSLARLGHYCDTLVMNNEGIRGMMEAIRNN